MRGRLPLAGREGGEGGGVAENSMALHRRMSAILAEQIFPKGFTFQGYEL